MANYKVSILYTRPNHRTDVPDAKEEEGFTCFYYLFNSPDRSNAPIVKLLGNNATIHIYIVYNFYWRAVFCVVLRLYGRKLTFNVHPPFHFVPHAFLPPLARVPLSENITSRSPPPLFSAIYFTKFSYLTVQL